MTIVFGIKNPVLLTVVVSSIVVAAGNVNSLSDAARESFQRAFAKHKSDMLSSCLSSTSRYLPTQDFLIQEAALTKYLWWLNTISSCDGKGISGSQDGFWNDTVNELNVMAKQTNELVEVAERLRIKPKMPKPSPRISCVKHPKANYIHKPGEKACALSCRQLQEQNKGEHLTDGVYWLQKMEVPVYCDFTHNGGGWTLLLTKANNQNWNLFTVTKMNILLPSLYESYSILAYGDYIKSLSLQNRFDFRIETGAEKGRLRWGGIWSAPSRYSLTTFEDQTYGVSLKEMFNSWNYNSRLGIMPRIPRLNKVHVTSGRRPLLTMCPIGERSYWFGTLVPYSTVNNQYKAPWINGKLQPYSDRVLYWIR